METKITNIPDADHVMRHVSWSKLRKDEDDNVLGFLPQAFELRPEEEALSVSWLEFYEQAETRLRDAVWAVRKVRDVRPKSAFAIGEVGDIKKVCLRANAKIRVVHEPKENWPAHAGIRRLPRGDLALLDALATDAFVQMVRNQEVPAEGT